MMVSRMPIRVCEAGGTYRLGVDVEVESWGIGAGWRAEGSLWRGAGRESESVSSAMG